MSNPLPPVPSPTPPAALVQAATVKAVALAEQQPDTPEAKATLQALLTLLVQIGTSLQSSGVLPQTWTRWVAAGMGVLTLIAGSGFIGHLTAPADPLRVTNSAKLDVILEKLNSPPSKAGCQCGCATTGVCVCKDCGCTLFKPAVKPPIVTPTARVVIYKTTATTDAEVANLPKGVTVDSIAYQVGSVYPFNGKSIPLPCVVLLGGDGKVVDVQPFTSVADAAAMLSKSEK